MYLEFFGLQARPFHSTPDPYFLYLSSSHKQALGSIIYGVKEKKGFIAVTGEVGLGKTTILRSFLAQIDQANQHTIYLLNPNLSFTSVVKTLLCELGQDPIEGDDAEITQQLHMVLIEKYLENKTVTLLIDDAQNIPVVTIEQLRMLSNLETSKDKLIQIVLLGQTELDTLLDRYELRQIRQRIAVRAIIRPLSQLESHQYIQHRLDKAGGKGKKVFTKAALGFIVREAEGIPRRLNILCDNALVTAFGYNKSQVNARIAKEVISDLSGRSPHSLWRLIPLAAGVLILVLALVALLPLAQSRFSEKAPLPQIGQLDDQGDNSSQELVNGEKDAAPSHQQTLVLADKSKNEMTAPVPEFLGQSRNLAIPSPDPTTILPKLEAGISHENPGNAVIGKMMNGDVKSSILITTGEQNNLAVSETAVRIAVPHLKKVDDLLGKEESIIEHGTRPIAARESQLAQDEAESRREVPLKATVLNRNLEKFGNPSKKQVVMNVTDKSNGRLKEDSRAPDSEPKTSAILQEVQIQKPDTIQSPLGVTKIMKDGDTVSGLLQDVYGLASPSLLRFVLDHNRHIVNVRRIFPGEHIFFPPISEKVEGLKKPIDASRVLVSNKVKKSRSSKKVVTQSVNKEEASNRLIGASHGLVSGKDKKLGSSKKIFTKSPARPKSNQVKNMVTRKQTYAVAIVQEGDTLEKLARVVYGSSDPLYVQRVLDFNPTILSPKKIFPGQEIAFPRVKN